MVQAWYLKDPISDPQDPNHLEPPQNITLDELKNKTGVEYLTCDADNYEKEGLLKKICDERGYSYMDEITCSRDKLANYEEKLKMFFAEHLHSDEEIRFVLDGAGYFDIRDVDDKWIRVEVVKNDLIVLPSGIYHRFILDKNNYIRVKRLFVGEPVWTSIPRSDTQDDHPARIQYLKLADTNFSS